MLCCIVTIQPVKNLHNTILTLVLVGAGVALIVILLECCLVVFTFFASETLETVELMGSLGFDINYGICFEV